MKEKVLLTELELKVMVAVLHARYSSPTAGVKKPERIKELLSNPSSNEHAAIMLRDLLIDVRAAIAAIAEILENNKIQEEVEELRAYNIPNWDGYDALPIQPHTVDIALTLSHVLSSDNPPDIAPGADGSIGFEWPLPNNNLLTICVSADGAITGKLVRGCSSTDRAPAF